MYPVPFNDRRRLEALAAYNVLDSAAEEAFDRLTRLARRQFDVPIAVVSLVDADRQWFKSHDGLDVSETTRELAFCSHAILEDETMVIRDAAVHPKFRNNGLVTGEPGIRFYAGAPLKTPEGFRLGTFCLIDREPRPFFSADDMTALGDFAAMAMQNMEWRRADDALKLAHETAGAAQNARKDVFSLVAHEIRSPIATMISLIRTVEERVFGPLSDPRYAEFLSDLKSTAEHVGQITDRMLDFARLGTGEIELEEKSVNVGKLLEAAHQASAGVADPKDVTIDLIPVEVGQTLVTDPTLSLQMLVNLLANAVKFSPVGGKVTLSARADKATGELLVDVTDSGTGMPDHVMSAVLDGPLAVGAPVQTGTGGTGLGLPLVKLLIEVHGGRLELARAETGGTAATLRFPEYRVAVAPEPVVS